jgi:hypothetical protein
LGRLGSASGSASNSSPWRRAARKIELKRFSRLTAAMGANGLR